MVRLLQHSAGPGCHSRRKMIGAFLWFLFSGLSGDIFSTTVYASDESKEVFQSTLQNSTKAISHNAPLFKKNTESSISKNLNAASLLHRSSRELPRIKNINELLFDGILENDRNSESIQKTPTKSKTFFVIPYLRPGRSDNKNEDGGELETRNTLIPTARFGRSDSDSITLGLESENYEPISKKYDTVIPMVRFGRSNDKRRGSVSTSVIPYPRLGRSLSVESENNAANNSDESSNEDYAEISGTENDSTDGTEIHDSALGADKRQKRELEDYDTVIPYPRPGRDTFEDIYNTQMLEKENKRESSDYVLPQMRYGRSMILLSSPKTDETTKQKPHIFVLPYPRPGRSSKHPEKIGYSKNLQVILPYPRPGRSKFDSSVEDLKSNKRQGGYMLPFARLGRSALNTPFEHDGKQSEINEHMFEDLKINPFFSKFEQKNLPDKPKDMSERNSVFIIPYPRPGKKSMKSVSSSHGKQGSSNVGKQMSDYVLPYPRPGKKSSKQLSSKNFKNNNNEVGNAQNFVLPYPRPGRSEANWFDENVGVKPQVTDENLDDSTFAKGNLNTENMFEDNDIYSENTDAGYYLSNSKKSKNTFMVPYARLGRSFETVVPYPRPGRSYNQYKDDGMDSDFSISDFDSFITAGDFTHTGNDNDSHLRYKRSNTVVPYPRLGRAESVIPYPRLGRSDSVIPYPRLGRSNSVAPYPRPGRSNFVVPYPRIGRSNSVLPYPRLGRSNSVIPYPRLGRSNTVVPYPRLGRSDTVVPYPRPGRSDSIVPYPRPGRSNSVVPYPRPGRSALVPLSPRQKRSLSVIPYPRLGRSRTEEAISSSRNVGQTGHWILPNLRPGRSDSNEGETYIIPYPRPGRSQNINEILQMEEIGYPYGNKRSKGNMIIPYPRLGRSNKYDRGYILPYLRFGRSSSNFKNEEGNTSRDTIIPYPRLGRSQEQVTASPHFSNSVHKLNKHMLARGDDSIYILPYPRPGRYSE